MSRCRRAVSAEKTALQQSFTVENAFKRNKRYVNYNKINSIEQKYQASRRRPNSSSSVDQKINSSFLNTTAAFSDRVESQIDKFKNRMSGANIINEETFMNHSRKSLCQSRPQSERSSRVTSRSPNNAQTERSQKKKIRGMKLDKYCSRQQYYRSKNKPVIDQRLFNNFYLEKPDEKHTKDFNTYSDRNLDFSLKNFHQLQYNTQKLYEQCYYRKTTMQCNFNFKEQKIKPRQLDTPKRKENLPATQLSPKNVEQSLQKCTMIRPKTVDGFYANSGRELPCQLDMRSNTNLTNYWVGQNGKVKRKEKEYSLRKLKDDLVERNKEQLKNRKKPKFQRKDLCDQMYFRVNPHM